VGAQNVATWPGYIKPTYEAERVCPAPVPRVPGGDEGRVSQQQQAAQLRQRCSPCTIWLQKASLSSAPVQMLYSRLRLTSRVQGPASQRARYHF
jgi:hypothetical protein